MIFNPMTKVEFVDLFITFRFSKSTKNRDRAEPKGTKTIFLQKSKNYIFHSINKRERNPLLYFSLITLKLI